MGVTLPTRATPPSSSIRHKTRSSNESQLWRMTTGRPSMPPSIWLTAGRAGRRGLCKRRGRRRRRAGTALLQVVQLLFKVAVRGRVAVGRRHVEEVLVGQVPLVDDQPRRLGRRQDLRAVGQLAVELIHRDAAILELLGRHPADRFAQRQRAAPGIAHHQHAHRPAVGQPLAQQPAGKEHRGVGQRLQGDPPHAERAHRAELGGNERFGVHPVLELGRGGRGSRSAGLATPGGRRCPRCCRPANRSRPGW